MGFRGRGRVGLPDSVREAFFKQITGGASVAVAAVVAGVSPETGRLWAKDAGYEPIAKRYGVRYSVQARAAFWRAMRAGSDTASAAQAAGVSERTARQWVSKAGFVPRTTECLALTDLCPLDTAPRGPMSFLERCRLEELLEQQYSPVKAAAFLGRHKDTIAREIKRGNTVAGYRAQVGQGLAVANAKRRKRRKLETNTALLAVVLEGLTKRLSPEQIAGRLRKDYPEDPEMWVSHETIYQGFYVQARGELARDLKAALRTGRITRKPQGRTSAQTRGKIKDMVSISERPAEAADRAIPGHWEGDLIIGAGGASQIGTLVERTTGFVVLLHLPDDRTAETVAAAMIAKLPEIPKVLQLSLTWDQGKEMASHTKITQATGLPIYFADPHSPWQRGTNENTNGLLRQYFPKGTDLSFYGPGWLDNVAAELNARPRKRFGYRTPAEELERLLSDPTKFVAATA